jgi:hypothetical protein
MTISKSSFFAKSQDPYATDWAAMGLPPEQGRTAFDGPIPSAPADPSKADKERARARAYAKAKYVPAAERNKAITEFKGAHLNLGPLSESPESKAKTARLIGRTNGARTQ